MKHLSQQDINNYIDGNFNSVKNNEIKQHISHCERCRKKIDDYQLLITAIRRNKSYEPCSHFVNLVTENLPDIYIKKEKPIIEIISLIMMLVPSSLVIGFLFYNNNLKFTLSNNIYDILSSFIISIYHSMNSIRFFHDNFKLLTVFVLYIVIFKTLDFLLHKYRIKRKYI